MSDNPLQRWSRHIKFITWLHYILVGLLVVMTVALLCSYYYIYS